MFIIHLPITNDEVLVKVKKESIATDLTLAALGSDVPVDIIPHEIKADSKDNVLIVEDNADVIHYLIKCLEHSYNIDIAMNGQEGIDLAMETIPDIIVSDVMMPIKDGLELLQELKMDEKTSHIPIVLLTVKADIASRLEGLKRRDDAYLIKPFREDELLVVIQNILETRYKLWLLWYYMDIILDRL